VIGPPPGWESRKRLRAFEADDGNHDVEVEIERKFRMEVLVVGVENHHKNHTRRGDNNHHNEEETKQKEEVEMEKSEKEISSSEDSEVFDIVILCRVLQLLQCAPPTVLIKVGTPFFFLFSTIGIILFLSVYWWEWATGCWNVPSSTTKAGGDKEEAAARVAGDGGR